MTMASRVGIMKEGRIAQIGSPYEIYETPNSRFVGDFIGNANMIAGSVTGGEGADWTIDSQELGCTITARHEEPLPGGSEVTVMVRPEKMSISRQPVAGAANTVSGRITDIAYLGDMSIYHVKLESGRKIQVSQANLRHGGGNRLEHEEEVSVSWHPGDSVVLLA